MLFYPILDCILGGVRLIFGREGIVSNINLLNEENGDVIWNSCLGGFRNARLFAVCPTIGLIYLRSLSMKFHSKAFNTLQLYGALKKRFMALLRRKWGACFTKCKYGPYTEM